jgi:hypothetical protein
MPAAGGKKLGVCFSQKCASYIFLEFNFSEKTQKKKNTIRGRENKVQQRFLYINSSKYGIHNKNIRALNWIHILFHYFN